MTSNTLKLFIFSWIQSAPLAGPLWNLGIINVPVRDILLWKSISFFFSMHGNYRTFLDLMHGFVEHVTLEHVLSWRCSDRNYEVLSVVLQILCTVYTPRQLEFSHKEQSMCKAKVQHLISWKWELYTKQTQTLRAPFKPWLLFCIHWKC